MRNRRKKILIALGCIALVVAAITFFSRNTEPTTEPTYQGHSLSDWVRYAIGNQNPRAQADASDAISQIGTDALPYLLKWMRYEDKRPPFQDNDLKSFFRRLPKRFIPRPLSGWAWGDYDEDTRAHGSALVIAQLGGGAKAAIPQLVEMLNNTNHARVSDRAAIALALMGEQGLQPLLDALAKTNTPELTRRTVANRIGISRNLERHASLAVPVLVKCLEASDPKIQYGAADALGRIVAEPLVVIPALTNCLNESTREDVRYAATWALGRYGEQARAAVPLLLTQLTNRDAAVRNWTTNTLHQIAPEVLTNSPAK
jgi:HEAT repeat protein